MNHSNSDNHSSSLERIKKQCTIHTILIDSPRCYGFMNTPSLTSHWPGLSSLCPPCSLPRSPGNVSSHGLHLLFTTPTGEKSFLPLVSFRFIRRRNGHTWLRWTLAEDSEDGFTFVENECFCYISFFFFFLSWNFWSKCIEIVLCRSVDQLKCISLSSYWDTNRIAREIFVVKEKKKKRIIVSNWLVLIL